MKKERWFIYTVVVGLLPFLIRLLIWIISNNLEIGYILNEIDMIAFGLILNVTNINEIEDKEKFDKSWRFWVNGFSVIMIVLMAAFLGIKYFAEVQVKTEINIQNVRNCSAVLATISLAVGYIVYNKLTKLGYE